MRRFLFIILLACVMFHNIAYAQSDPNKVVYKPEKKEGFFQKFLKLSEQEPFTGSYAIIVAIGDYEHLPPLKSVKRDAEKMKNFLIGTGEYDEVVVLQDDGATFETIRYCMQVYFPQKMMEKGRYRFIFYFSGHGAQYKGYGGNTIGYLLLRQATGALNDSYTIEMKQIENWAARFRYATHMLFLLDSCFSGLAGTEIKSYDTTVNPVELAKENGRYMITAGGADETSIADLKQWNGSLFTEVAITGMQGDADFNRDSIVTTYELFSYVQASVKNEARKSHHSQTPLLSNLGSYKDKGQYFFVYNEPKFLDSANNDEIATNTETEHKSEQKPRLAETSTKESSYSAGSIIILFVKVLIMLFFPIVPAQLFYMFAYKLDWEYRYKDLTWAVRIIMYLFFITALFTIFFPISKVAGFIISFFGIPPSSMISIIIWLIKALVMLFFPLLPLYYFYKLAYALDWERHEALTFIGCIVMYLIFFTPIMTIFFPDFVVSKLVLYWIE